MQEKYKLQIDHISRIYEQAKDAIFRSCEASSTEIKTLLDGLQELRNIACENIQILDRLTK